MVRIVRAEFETSAADPSGWPADGPDEVAFVGRSNVGKSSLMNALAQRKGLARTSNEPGRTRLVNFFVLELLDGEARREVRFVDLPGYGFARVSKTERATWRPTIERYLSSRPTLRAVVLLVDARRIPAAGSDAAAVEDAIGEERALERWIAQRGVEVVPVITKSDKLAKHERAVAAERLRRMLERPVVLASAVTLAGMDRLWDRLLSSLRAATPAGLTTSDPSD